MCLDDGCHSLTRREFLVTTVTATVGGMAVGSASAAAQMTDHPAPDPFLASALRDPRVIHGPVMFASGNARIRAHVARPVGEGRYRPILVNHGNTGLPEDVVAALAHLAQRGYVALTYDSDTRSGAASGAVPQSPDYYRSETFSQQILADNVAALAFLREQSFASANQGVAMLGFCGGGYSVIRQATTLPEVRAVVGLYAPPEFPMDRTNRSDPRPDMYTFVGKVNAPVQLHYGTRDPLIPVPIIERHRAALTQRSAVTELYMYQGADHAFCDYTRDSLYDESSARDAYRRVDRFLERYYPAT